MDFVTQRRPSKLDTKGQQDSLFQSEYFDRNVLNQKDKKLYDFSQLPKLEFSQEIHSQNNSRDSQSPIPNIYFEDSILKNRKQSIKNSHEESFQNVDDLPILNSKFRKQPNLLEHSLQSINSQRSQQNKESERDIPQFRSENKQTVQLKLRKKHILSPSKIQQQRKRVQINFFQRNQQINYELFKKWTSDEEIKLKCQNFHQSVTNFLKEFPQKSLQKVLKMIEFKNYLKPIFINDHTSIIQLHNDMEFEQLCSRVFSLKLYEQYLNERFTHQQIQQFKQAQKLLKQTSNSKEIQQIQAILVKLKIPLYTEYVKDVLLVDLMLLAEQLDDTIIKKETEIIEIAGQQLQQTKASMQHLEIQLIKKQQKEQLLYNSKVKNRNLPNDNLTSFQGVTNLSLIENVNKVFYLIRIKFKID